MVDPVVHAQMAQLIRDEKEYEEEFQKLEKEELPLWKKRVALAEKKGKLELAEEAAQRVRQIELRLGEIELELESLQDRKKRLRFQARRPSGREVQRAEAMLESVRQGGLIDPDEASLKRKIEELEKSGGEDEVALDFGDED